MDHNQVIRIARFIVVGGSAAAVEFLSFVTLITLTSSPAILANMVSFLSGFAVSFVFNKSWVFASRGGAKKQLAQYTVLAVTNLAISNVAIWIISMYTQGYVLIAAKVFVMIVIASWNYVIFHKVIFKNNSHQE